MSAAKTTISAIAAFNDNYIWAITNLDTDKVALVDPGDASVCISYLEKHCLTLCAILITHHHRDHTGGIQALIDFGNQRGISIDVYGPVNDAIAHITKPVNELDKIFLSDLQCEFSVLALPGHTLDHIAFFNDNVVFCGDTLFSGGCGRLFEGTPRQMHQSLAKLAQLDDNTLVYCAHEYTQDNLTFALTVEPNNEKLQRYAVTVKELRQQEASTIPTSIGLEKQINPFLRCDKNEVKLSAEHYEKSPLESSVAVFSTIRAWKNSF